MEITFEVVAEEEEVVELVFVGRRTAPAAAVETREPIALVLVVPGLATEEGGLDSVAVKDEIGLCCCCSCC